jgi:pyruvate dehydrogenase E1 component alpha subunit
MPGLVVDGQDVLAVHEAVEAAVARARQGRGPSLIECKTYRMRSHAEGVPDVDHVAPRSESEKEAWAKRDPIILFGHKLVREGFAQQAELTEIEARADAEVAELDKYQEQCPVRVPKDASVLDTLLYAP